MGGLISLYAGLTEPQIFGKLLIFSPSIWMSKKILLEAQAFKPLPLSKMYIYAGGKESDGHLRNVKKFCSILIGKIQDAFHFDLEVSVNLEGQHREIFWKEEFPKAITWLFFNKQK
jgi:predicted alpha/beta superfamily hydrolase